MSTEGRLDALQWDPREQKPHIFFEITKIFYKSISDIFMFGTYVHTTVTVTVLVVFKSYIISTRLGVNGVCESRLYSNKKLRNIIYVLHL